MCIVCINRCMIQSYNSITVEETACLPIALREFPLQTI